MGTSAGDLLGGFLREQAAVFARAEADLAAGGPEAVHDARVVCRRLRAALGELPRLLDADAAGLRERLRDWGHTLGEARDLEVQLAALTAPTPPGLSTAQARARARAVLGPRLDAARAEVVGRLGTAQHLLLRADLEAAAAEPPLTAKAARAWDDELPRGLARAEKRVRRREQAVREAPAAEHDAAEHAVRKAARRARFTAEIVARGDGSVAREAAETAARYRDLQDELGAAHDAAILRSVVEAVRAAALAAGEPAEPYDKALAALAVG